MPFLVKILSVPFPSPALNLHSDSVHCSWVCIVKILCQITIPSSPHPYPAPCHGCRGENEVGHWWPASFALSRLEKEKGQKSHEAFILFILAVSCQVIWSPSVLLTTCVSCLFFIRHSPKVVKAASQVLNSMWQYRDLRSLYKKVRFALLSWLGSCTQTLSLKTIFGHNKMCHRFKGTLSESLSKWNTSETRTSVKKQKKGSLSVPWIHPKIHQLSGFDKPITVESYLQDK